MKFRTITGAIIEPKSDEIAEQMIKAGYEVVEEDSTNTKATKTSKKSEQVD